MRPSGDVDAAVVAARAALLDALAALAPFGDAVILVGAQALYMHTGEAPVAIAEYTTDADLAMDTRRLPDNPRIEAAMEAARFRRDRTASQPGSWISPAGVPVDLMVAERQAGAGGRRGARIPPHDANAARRARGLEAALVDNEEMLIRAHDPASDRREARVRVAGPAALLVAKLHKIAERLEAGRAVAPKDAHDVYRPLQAVSTPRLASSVRRLRADHLSGEVTVAAMRHLAELFATGADAAGSRLAGRAEEQVGDPEFVAASVAVLAADLISEVGEDDRRSPR